MASYYDIADLVHATLFSDKKKKITNIDPTLLRAYPGANRLVKKNVVKEQGGLDIRWRVNVTGNTSARSFGPYHTVTRTQGDHLKTASMRMGNLRADFSLDILEPEFNMGEFEIVDVIKNREQQAKIDLTKKVETDWWGNAVFGDDETPQGVLYWFPYCASAGFVGTYPSGYSSIAGLDPNVYTGWKSYGDVWVAATDADLFLKMRTAFSLTNFQAPITPMIVGDFNTGNQWGLYTNLRVVLQFEDAAKLQNDNIGNDLSYFSGRALFHRTPLEEVPTLQDNARDPIIGLNWGLIENHVLRGWWMKEKKVAENADQPLVVSYDYYCIYQPIVLDRRQGGFNIAKAA